MSYEQKLKYPLRISAMLFLLTHSLYSNNDSLGTKKGSFYVFANAGVPVYNRLQMGDRQNGIYTVHSKPKVQYNAGFINRLVK